VSQKVGNKIANRQLLFVDLAGSERIGRTGVEGVAKDQAISINGSLSALGKVIKAIGDGENHIPFRDSNLTLLLRGSFSGKAKTSVVINVASEFEHSNETQSSL
jgi:hypothetical protein